MPRAQDTDDLSKHLDRLKQRLDGTDIASLESADQIDSLLAEISDAHVRIKQYILRHQEPAWSSWGPKKWGYIERSKVALESRLATLQQLEDRKVRRYDRRMSLLSAFFVAISAVAACASAYFAYQTVRSSPPSNDEVKAPMSDAPDAIESFWPA